MWTAIVSIFSTALKWGYSFFVDKNSAQEIAAKNATTESKIDQDSTRAVQDAIDKNDVSGLQK